MVFQAEKKPIISVRNLSRHFDTRRGLDKLFQPKDKHLVRAVHDVSLNIYKGETLGLIGESGCGKSTLGRTLLMLQRPTSGSIKFHGQEITTLSESEMRRLRSRLQIIFQDPFASLNPRKTVEQIISLPLNIMTKKTASESRKKVIEISQKSGLKVSFLKRYPKQFSGGQRQRIGIARALVLDPEFVVCDEPVSALDVSVQAQIIKLLQSLKKEFELTFLFISHDLSVVSYLSDRIAVMYLGQIVEIGTRSDLLEKPSHPYTQVLLSAVPDLNKSGKERIRLKGDLPSPMNPPSGCTFHTRCPQATEICKNKPPEMTKLTDEHFVRCHLFGSQTNEGNVA